MVINQAYLFLIFTITGIIIGILFDFFRALRKCFKTSDWVTYIQDIIFWIMTGFILLFSIFTFSDGEVRFYMFIGVFLGCLFYLTIFSHFFLSCNIAIIEFLKKIFITIFKIIIFPFKLSKNLFFLKIKKDFNKKRRKI